MEYTLGQLADKVSAKVVGDSSCVIKGVATLENAQPDQITFLTNSAYRKKLSDTKAGAVILSASDAESCPVNALVSDDPYATYAMVASVLYPEEKYPEGIHQSACIADDVTIPGSASIAENVVIETGVEIGESVRIGPGCVIQRNSAVGAGSVLTSNISVAHNCIIGKNNLIHSGVVIGADGFGQAMHKGTWIKVPQVGRVITGNDVEIGANTTIDRGAIEDTEIGDNVKLDNQIQVAHNVKIGQHTAIAGCTAIAGSTRIGQHCKIAGMVGIVGHLDIADNVMITAMSLVTRSISEAGVYSASLPLESNKQWRKNSVRFKQLDEMAKRLKKLEKQISD